MQTPYSVADYLLDRLAGWQAVASAISLVCLAIIICSFLTT